jgi:hypothetical protein
MTPDIRVLHSRGIFIGSVGSGEIKKKEKERVPHFESICVIGVSF